MAWRSARPRSVTTTPASRIDLAAFPDGTPARRRWRLPQVGQARDRWCGHASMGLCGSVRGRTATQAQELQG